MCFSNWIHFHCPLPRARDPHQHIIMRACFCSKHFYRSVGNTLQTPYVVQPQGESKTFQWLQNVQHCATIILEPNSAKAQVYYAPCFQRESFKQSPCSTTLHSHSVFIHWRQLLTYYAVSKRRDWKYSHFWYLGLHRAASAWWEPWETQSCTWQSFNSVMV